jgi:hypothetical protein
LEAARQLAELMELILDVQTPGRQLVKGQIPGSSLYSGGWVTANYLANEPDEPSILDHYDVLWSIGSSDRRAETVHAEARRLFELATERLPWPTLLMDDGSWLIAVWSPAQGKHDFPERTSWDRKHQELWMPHIPT